MSLQKMHKEVIQVRKPHVHSLHYEVKSGASISYRDPKPLMFSNHMGEIRVQAGKLDIILSDHFSYEEEARRAVEPFLRSWEIEADLSKNIGMIRFDFVRSEIIDLDPPPPDTPQVVHISGSAHSVSFVGDVQLHLICNHYPDPPRNFHATFEVEIGYQRWKNFREGKEPLQSMAYFVLTLIEKTAGSRKKAAQIYQIDYQILDNVGKLSTSKGDGNTARKAIKLTEFQELSGSEKQWLENAVKVIVYRLGEHAAGEPLKILTMDDLPKLF